MPGIVSASKDFIIGMGHSIDSNLLYGATFSINGIDDNDLPKSTAFKVGSVVGDIVSLIGGGAQTAAGGGGEVFGVGLDSTVVLSPAGVAVNVASAAVVANGLITVDRSSGSLASDLSSFADNGGKNESKPVYKPSPKHDPKSGWGSPNPIPDEKVGQQLLDSAYSSSKNKQKYNIYEDKLIKFQPDGDGWHPYEVKNPSKEVPTDVLRQMLDDGVITKTQYKKFITNK